ncbi:RNA polymerase sigma factor [Aquimarina longa]|uniref:RNA polymerase sigma factor n=1 Tax=Aquimarina longa TaxID=1080221 RepID=UPI0007858660|nr:sigma-70 family RNA polymerase sigma factor [Aquimarina longa]
MKITSFSDNTILVSNLIKGNEDAYVFLVNTYHKKIYVYALSLTNDKDMAQDIVQNVFIKTWVFREKLKTDFSIQSFLYKTAYNEFINQYHKKQSVSILEKTYAETLQEVIENTDESVLVKKITLINKEIEKLPVKCKQVFLLSRKEGLTNIEIAEYLSISVKSVEAHITKAFSTIRKELKEKISQILFLFFRQKV